MSTYQYDVINDSYDNWLTDAPCGRPAFLLKAFEKVIIHWDATQPISKAFYYDDPNDEQGGGVLGVTTLSRPQIAFNRDGKIYRYNLDSDIVFSSNVNWIKTTDIETDFQVPP